MHSAEMRCLQPRQSRPAPFEDVAVVDAAGVDAGSALCVDCRLARGDTYSGAQDWTAQCFITIADCDVDPAIP